MSTRSADLILITINHEHVPLEERERYSVEDSEVENLYKSLRQIQSVSEPLILQTCNRFELYAKASAPREAQSQIEKALDAYFHLGKNNVSEHAKYRHGQEVIEHLIEVSAGLRSQITGEAEIFGQVKSAYSLCQKLGYAGATMNRVFQKGFQAAKLIRHSTPIGEGQINIATVAVDLSQRIFGQASGIAALVIGTGEIGEKTVKALRSRGATNLGLASHTMDRAKQVAEEWGGKPHVLSKLESYLDDYDVVVASTNTEDPFITKSLIQSHLAVRKDRPLFLVDLGMPRNIDQRCDDFDNIFLYNLDDLALIAEENLLERKKAVQHSRDIAQKKAMHIWDTLAKRGLVG